MISKNVNIGVIAHVDAGKTTLCEAMLYLSGSIRKLGRVDHRDSFLDDTSMERERGITIFSKQARLRLAHTEVTLVDTPGHVDFSPETERAMKILDYAILVISGTDGVQAHTETVWKLLRHYGVPCFLFVTKMDLPVCDRARIFRELRARLGDGCVDFRGAAEDVPEQLAVCRDDVMDEYLETGAVSDASITSLIASGDLFPVFFGSGLRTEGVADFMDFLDAHTRAPVCGETFGASVYKIGRDPQGLRLTWMKLTGGTLSAREPVTYRTREGGSVTEKIHQIRLYSGARFEAAETARAGQLVAVTGLSETFAGGIVGDSSAVPPSLLEPVLQYRVVLPEGADPVAVLPKLMQLNDESPELCITGAAGGRTITVRLMGRVQEEIFRALVKDRFDLDVTLDTGHIMYRETIAGTAEGVGHFEPLRHYAEVHLILEPLPRGSGIVLESSCSEDRLDRNWQRLILTHLAEKQHAGVLTGAPLTDVKITLVSGRAHPKHTEGGDFRQATYRAVRQGLMQAGCVLLEPWYAFTLELPREQLGRAITDIRAMSGSVSSTGEHGGAALLEGICPVSTMAGYAGEVLSYTHGRGRLFCRPDGYRPCHDAEAVVAASGYLPEADTDNPADSVFCAHGSGFIVRWDRVFDYMHLDPCLKDPAAAPSAPPPSRRSTDIDERELEAIMEREFGPIRRRQYREVIRNEAPAAPSAADTKRSCVIVDGYNVIFSWDELKALAAQQLDLARARLMDILSNYAAFTKSELILVFDAYRTPGNPGSRSDWHNIHVVYTKDGETADRYIEALTNDIGKNYNVRVITSDALIQISAVRSGVLRTSSREFETDVKEALARMEEVLRDTNSGAHTTKLQDGIQL